MIVIKRRISLDPRHGAHEQLGAYDTVQRRRQLIFAPVPRVVAEKNLINETAVQENSHSPGCPAKDRYSTKAPRGLK